MKKIALLFTFLLFMGSKMYGQTDFRFGFQVSPTFSWISTDDKFINGNGTNLGLKLGMLGEKYFAGSESYALTFGVGFAFNQGGTLSHDSDGEFEGGNYWSQSELSNELYRELPDPVNLKYSIQYIEIPIGLKMRTQEFGYLRYFVEPGFNLGIKTQARGAISGASFENVENEDIKKDVNFLNIALGLGAGVEYTIGENTALVGGLYFQNGFIDMTDDGATRFQRDGATLTEIKEDSKASVKSITIRIGVMF